MWRKLGCSEKAVPVASSICASVSSSANAELALAGGCDLPALPFGLGPSRGRQRGGLDPGGKEQGARAGGRGGGARVTVLQQCSLLCRPQILQPAGHRHLPSNEPRAWPLPWQPFRLGSLPDDPEDVLGFGLFPPREPRALRLLSLAALVSSLFLSTPGDQSVPELTPFSAESGE